MIKTKKAPWYIIESLLFENGFQAVVLYRIAHWFKSRRIPFFGPLFGKLSVFLTGVDIAPGAQIGPGLLISHGVGLVIGGHARIGSGALLLHQVTIGSPNHGRVEQMPTIGDNAFIGAGAKLIGGIQVGDDVSIGVNCIIAEDIPSGSRVRSTSGLIIRQPSDKQTTEREESPVSWTKPERHGLGSGDSGDGHSEDGNSEDGHSEDGHSRESDPGDSSS